MDVKQWPTHLLAGFSTSVTDTICPIPLWRPHRCFIQINSEGVSWNLLVGVWRLRKSCCRSSTTLLAELLYIWVVTGHTSWSAGSATVDPCLGRGSRVTLGRESSRPMPRVVSAPTLDHPLHSLSRTRNSSSLPVPLFPSPVRPSQLAVKCLKPDEIASHCELGLCFTYDEKYHRGHCCVSRVFLFVAKKEDPP